MLFRKKILLGSSPVSIRQAVDANIWYPVIKIKNIKQSTNRYTKYVI